MSAPLTSLPETAQILVVEDNPSVRAFMQRALQDGYGVTAAADAAEALALLAQDRFQMLLTDIALSEMDGTELVARARAMQQDLRVLLVTGYPEARLRAQQSAPALPVLPKPFTVAELRDAVRDVLALPV